MELTTINTSIDLDEVFDNFEPSDLLKCFKKEDLLDFFDKYGEAIKSPSWDRKAEMERYSLSFYHDVDVYEEDIDVSMLSDSTKREICEEIYGDLEKSLNHLYQWLGINSFAYTTDEVLEMVKERLGNGKYPKY